MSGRSPILLVLATGCGLMPLAEVPIEGGSPEQRELVRSALERFDRDVGSGRVGLHAVTFVSDAYVGGYRPTTRTIRLDPDLDLDLIPLVVTHELCHALDYQEDLLARPGTVWDDVIGPLFHSDAMVLSIDAYPTERTRRSEAFATFCGQGPWTAQLASESCAGDPPEAQVLTRWLMDEVWQGVGSVPIGAGVGYVGSWDAGLEPETIGVVPTTDPGVVQLRAIGSGRASSAAVELFGGAEVANADPGAPSATTTAEDASSGAVPVSITKADPTTPEADGPALTVESLDLVHLGTARRLLRSDGERWEKVADGCIPPVSAVFATEDAAWLAQTVGTTVTWGIAAP